MPHPETNSSKSNLIPRPDIHLNIRTDERGEIDAAQMPQLRLMSPVSMAAKLPGPPHIQSPPSVSPLMKLESEASSFQQNPHGPAVLQKIVSPSYDKQESKVLPCKQLELKVKKMKPLSSSLSSQSSRKHLRQDSPHGLPVLEHPSPIESSSISPSPVHSVPVSLSSTHFIPPIESQPSSADFHHSPELPPLTPSCSPSPLSPIPFSAELIASDSPVCVHTKSPELKRQYQDNISPPTTGGLLSCSSSSLSSDSCDDQMDPSPVITSPSHQIVSVPPPSDLSMSALSPHLGVSPIDIESFSTSSESPSPSTSSISSISIPNEPFKPQNVSTESTVTSLPPLSISSLPHLPVHNLSESPLSYQEEEEDSSDSESSAESVEHPEYPVIKSQVDKGKTLERGTPIQLESPSPTGSLTVSIKNSSLELPHSRELKRLSLTTSTVVVDSNSSKYKNVDSIFIKDTKGYPSWTSATTDVQLHSSSALIVKISRRLLQQSENLKSVTSPDIEYMPKPVLPGRMKFTNTCDELGKGGQNRMRNSRKRELELSEVGLQPKKVKWHSCVFISLYYAKLYHCIID